MTGHPRLTPLTKSNVNKLPRSTNVKEINSTTEKPKSKITA
jgi:hypothetical protein